MIGTPPQTAASNSRLTLFFSAIFASTSPYFAIKALFAVITCFLFFNDSKTNFLAIPSAPPISSIIISTSLILGADKQFFNHNFFGILNDLFLLSDFAETKRILGIILVLLNKIFLFFFK